MLIFSENVFDSSNEEMKPVVKEALDHFKEESNRIIKTVRKEYVPLLQDFLKDLAGGMKGTAVGKELDTLNLTTLVNFAKQYIVPQSNEIIAMKIKQDANIYVYLAYSKDRQLLPPSMNKYLIIKAQTLTKDVEELFAQTDLIILK